jgi:hypothetical protein
MLRLRTISSLGVERFEISPFDYENDSALCGGLIVCYEQLGYVD